jgi:transcription initiation factor IIE alpha subunit
MAVQLRFAQGNSLMNHILQYLKANGERLDTDIAEATGYTLAKVRAELAELASKGEIMVCHSTRFDNGKKVEGVSCRLAGFIPPAAPGRKSKSQLKLS